MISLPTENKCKVKPEINVQKFKFRISITNFLHIEFPNLIFHTSLKSQEMSGDHPPGYYKAICKNAKTPIYRK